MKELKKSEKSVFFLSASSFEKIYTEIKVRPEIFLRYYAVPQKIIQRPHLCRSLLLNKVSALQAQPSKHSPVQSEQ